MFSSDWSHGYNVTQGYTFGFYRELGPRWLDFVANCRNVAAPGNSAVRPLRYLELGCGQGFGLCVLAAANPDMDFLGIDFSPEHIAHARTLAHRVGLTNIRFEERDFLEFADQWPAEFGVFDYATLHGIYSWVPQPVRAAIVSALGRCLAPGGMVYVSYNSMPGWTSTLPIQHILQEASRSGKDRGIDAITNGAALIRSMQAAGAIIFTALPKIEERLKTFEGKDPAYLVQEYLHDNWHPLWASQVADEMSAAKLSYIGTASLPENMLPGVCPAPMRDLIASQPARMQQDLVDCAINQGFRRDIFIRGKSPVAAGAANPVFQQTVHLIGAIAEELTVSTSFGLQKFSPIYAKAIRDSLSSGPATLGELASLPCFNGNRNDALQAVLLLIWQGSVGLGGQQIDPTIAHRFNRAIIDEGSAGAPYRALVAPVLNAGIPVRDVDLMAFSALEAEPDRGKAAARLVASLTAINRSMVVDGKPVQGDAAVARAREIVDEVADVLSPSWMAMGVLP